MLRISGSMLALGLFVAVSAAPTAVLAESGAKAKPAKVAEQKSSSSNEFEENRRAHMEKSKENNAKKGAE